MYHLMKEEDYKHTWVLNENTWYIKLYLWYWMASKTDITFCKLFWGYSLLFPLLPVRFLLGMGIGVANTVARIRYRMNYARGLRRQRIENSACGAQFLLAEADGPGSVVTPVPSEPKPAKKHAPWIATHGRRVVNQPIRLSTNGLVSKWLADPVEREVISYGIKQTVRESSVYVDDNKRVVFDTPGEHVIELRAYDKNLKPYTVKHTITVLAEPTKAMQRMDKIVGVFKGSLNATADGVAFLILKGQAAAAPFRFVGRALLKLLKWGSLTSLVGGFGFGIYEAVVNWSHYGPTLLHMAGVALPWAGVGIVGCLLAVLLVWMVIRTGFGIAMRDLMSDGAEVVAEKGAQGAVGFFKMMRIGYKSIKGNTCPRVVVEGDNA
jgi:hypothetical protein